MTFRFPSRMMTGKKEASARLVAGADKRPSGAAIHAGDAEADEVV
jgi:hypothetical protein